MSLKFSVSLFLVSFLIACNNSSSNEVEEVVSPQSLEFYGGTQGTTFAVICNDSINLSQSDITQILSDFDQALSGYIPESIVTKLNEYPVGVFSYEDQFNYFDRCFEMAQEVYLLTEGAFDPTVFPLVKGWGFLQDIEQVPDSSEVDSLRAYVGFQDGVHFKFEGHGVNEDKPNESVINKITPNAKLDFNAIAQGLAVDVIAEELERRGADNYFVEIGGEIRVSGVNLEGETWRIGIDQPIENSSAANRELKEVIRLKNKSVATSGSYRKFYEKNGEKYSHTLNPKSGYPVKHTLLSATVVADDCAFADAMATAFMVMGPEKSIEFIESNSALNIEVYLIYTEKGEEKVFMSKGFKRLLS